MSEGFFRTESDALVKITIAKVTDAGQLDRVDHLDSIPIDPRSPDIAGFGVEHGFMVIAAGNGAFLV